MQFLSYLGEDFRLLFSTLGDSLIRLKQGFLNFFNTDPKNFLRSHGPLCSNFVQL